MIVRPSEDEYEFHVGDRVEFVRDDYHYELIPAGTTGTVIPELSRDGTPYLSRVSHATMNGGGYDLPVRLDDGRRVRVRAEGHITYIRRITEEVTR